MSNLPDMTEAVKQTYMQIMKGDKNLLAVAQEFVVSSCKRCAGSGEDPMPRYAFGDIWYVDCEDCNGRGH